MLFQLTWLAGAVALGAMGTWLARSYALRRDWLDHPNERSFHKRPVPRIGGMGVLLPVVLALILMVLTPALRPSGPLLAALLPALGVALLSLFDDRFELSRRVRFLGHGIFAALVLYFLSPAWVGGTLPIFGGLLPGFLVAILLFIWIAGLTNAYNFMDGIDGIAGVQGLVAVLGWSLLLMTEPSLSWARPEVHMLIPLALAGGLLGFLVLNWAPASIFMGDIGSTFLGFFLAAFPLAAASMGLPLDRALEAGVFFVWPFVADAGMTFTRRLIRREPVFEAHRTHVYQVLAASYSSRDRGHRVTTGLFGLLALTGVGLFLSDGPLWAKLTVLAWLWVAVVAWTYGIRTRSSLANPVNSGSTQGANSRDDASHSSLPSAGTLMPFDIFLSPPDISEVEHRRVNEALASNFIAPVGPHVSAFEDGLARYLGVPEMLALNSGTAAVHLGLRALGVGPGDCVLCPDLTFVATVNPVRYLGAEPVLIDVNPGDWGMNPDLAREAIRKLRAAGRTVRAMVVVHAFGVPADLEALLAVSREEGVALLEDCAGAFGSRHGGRLVGTIGDAAAFSFNGNKVLTTSGGGALHVKNADGLRAARSWANQGKLPNVVGYQHQSLGYNYKLSNICAAIGVGQLETVDARLERKRAVFLGYRERLGSLAGLAFMPEPEHGANNYWLTCIGLESGAESVMLALREQRIEAAPMWKPMHQQALNQDLQVFGGETSEAIYQSFISLPSGSALTQQQMDRVCQAVQSQLLVAR